MHIPGFQIERELGQGGMAIVYLALQQSLRRHVALKVIKPVLTTDEEFAQRFLREGRIIAQLSDPHIVTVYDIASHEGNYYLSMEYLPGGTLQQRIRKGLELAETLSIGRAIVGALHYAHRRGVIHRDIKPQNILFRENGQPVLTDFGIAKTLGANSIMTRTGLSLGTPRYMSPEQIRGQGVDARADLYSFGVLFYEMLTGNVPYTAEDSFALAMMHVTSPVPEAPPHLRRFQSLLNKLLEKDPNQRFQSGQQVIAAIDAVETGDFDLFSVTGPAQPVVTPGARLRRGLGWKIGLPVAALAGATLAGGYWFLYRPTIRPAPPLVVSTPVKPPLLETPVAAIPPATAPVQTPAVDVDTQTPPAEAQEQQRQARLQAEQFFEQAQRARQDGALQVSLAYIEQGLQAMPDYPGLLSLKQDVLQQQMDLQRQEDEARRQAEAMEREKAETAQRQRQADEYLTQALDEQHRRAYETSLLRIEQGLQQVPDHQRLLALRQEVRKQLREDRAAPPAPVVKPPVDDSARIAGLLNECAAHLRANRLTVGRDGNAADCYNEVLKLDRSNAEALAGIDRIAERYAELVSAAIKDGNLSRARSYLGRMESIDPNYAQLPRLRQQLALAEIPKPIAAPPAPKSEPPPPAPEPQMPVVPPIDLVSVPQPAEQASRTVLEQKPEMVATTSPEPPAVTPKPPPPAVKPVKPESPERQVATLGRQAPNCLSGNCENGQGTYRYPDGSEYSGDFRNAKMHGQGTYVYAGRGEKYVGEWRNGVINGQGTYYYRSGNRYDGQWRNGRKNGQGVYLYANRGDRYEGQFANDRPNGQGTYYYSNGDRYEGEWRNGRKHGQGVLYEGGQKIVGEWRNDQKVRVQIAQ